MIREIVKMGSPVLRREADLITQFDTPELHQLVDDLLETMRANDGAGLAAPQINISKQVVIFGFDESDFKDEQMAARVKERGPVPLTILINPVITPLSDEMEEGLEGCLSIPGLCGMVPRYQAIRYQGFDQYGKPIDCQVHGFHARVVQHECDHLFGKLYIDRMIQIQSLQYIDVYQQNMANAE